MWVIMLACFEFISLQSKYTQLTIFSSDLYKKPFTKISSMTREPKYTGNLIVCQIKQHLNLTNFKDKPPSLVFLNAIKIILTAYFSPHQFRAFCILFIFT